MTTHIEDAKAIAQNTILSIDLVEDGVLRRSAEVEMARHRALSDLLHTNAFQLNTDHTKDHSSTGYHLVLKIAQNQLQVDVQDAAYTSLEVISINLRGFKKLIKDYFLMCESFYRFAKSGQTHKIEAVDMARRGLHNEGAALLQRKLAKYAACDLNTARQLFTLICVLHIRVTV